MIIFTLLQIAAIVVVTLPLSIGATIAAQWRPLHPVFFGISHLWGRLLLRIARVSLTVRGAEHVKPGAGYVLVANHASLFDIAAVLAGVPGNICFVLKRELTRVPIWGWGLIRSPYIVVDRTRLRDARRGMEKAEGRLREHDRSVLFFPEGTRTRDGKLQAFKRGAFTAAVNTHTPVVPIAINGSMRILPKGAFRINGGHVDVVIGEPMEPASEQEIQERSLHFIRSHYIDQ